MELSLRQEKHSLLHRPQISTIKGKHIDTEAAISPADEFVELLGEGDEPVNVREPEDRRRERILLKPMVIIMVVAMIFIISAILTILTAPIIEEEEAESAALNKGAAMS